ncbi:hypothetical protein [Mucilaginibacter sp. dw_454]|uniref:hypothetical protein n=1 Tax=Mucilaginibacter sp. dw_454 TaxID=2720079 RepID=UPI001BD39E4E|nr:hypothetical protein [Mucilaginibacter sp. dw_454]
MKKKSTMVFQSGKTETDNAELQTNRINSQKMYRDHRASDYHGHGRCNKFPFGSSHGPLYF